MVSCLVFRPEGDKGLGKEHDEKKKYIIQMNEKKMKKKMKDHKN